MPARIYSLAKELKLDSKVLVDICTSAGVTGKGSALASLTDEEVERVKTYISGGAQSGKAPARARAASGVATAEATEAVRREDYIAPGGTGSERVPVLPDRKKKKPADGESGPAPKTPTPKPAAIKLAPLPEVAQATDPEIETLLATMNTVLARPLGRDDVLATFAGLRPLLAGSDDDETSDLSRRHAIIESPSGVLSVVGGKLTTYREMSADTVDVVLEDVLPALRAGSGRRSILERVQRHSRTKRLKLRGAAGYKAALEMRCPTIGRLGVEHLVGRHGGETRTLLAMIEHDPSLGDVLVEGLPYRSQAFAAPSDVVGTATPALTWIGAPADVNATLTASTSGPAAQIQVQSITAFAIDGGTIAVDFTYQVDP